MPDGTELAGPVDYAPTWLVVAAGLVALVVAYYVAVWLWGRGDDTPHADPRERVDDARTTHLKELERLEMAVRNGRVPVRSGFQQLSVTVRSFVAEASGVPATSMTLADLRASEHPRVADAIAVMYPPAFAPDTATADDFTASLRDARELVTSWT